MFYLVKLQKENSLNKLTDKLKNGENFENSFINIYGRSAKDIWEEFNNKLIK